MPNKVRAKQSSTTTRQQARLTILQEYELLQHEWSRALQNDDTNWPTLFCLYYKLAALERRAPWLKKEGMA